MYRFLIRSALVFAYQFLILLRAKSLRLRRSLLENVTIHLEFLLVGGWCLRDDLVFIMVLLPVGCCLRYLLVLDHLQVS